MNDAGYTQLAPRTGPSAPQASPGALISVCTHAFSVGRKHEQKLCFGVKREYETSDPTSCSKYVHRECEQEVSGTGRRLDRGQSPTHARC